MISRRIIRVKVMQCLYALQTGNEVPFPYRPANGKPVSGSTGESSSAAEMLQRHFDATFGLFAFQLWFLTETARYAETDARNRAAKHLPSEEDLVVPVKIAGNPWLWRLLESPLYEEGIKRFAPKNPEAYELVKLVYTQLGQSTPYAVYNAEPGRDKKAEKEILEFIFTDLMLANDTWVSYVEEHFPNWDDDAEMLQLLTLQYLQKPGVYVWKDLLSRDKFDFAVQLFETVKEKKEELDTWIKPRLLNWDSERLAQLDTILLEMGVAEFLYFETIPVKVTINEYIDLAKAYSTQQSGHFVNGILDNVRKDLESAGRLHKVAFKKGGTS
jgi:N utilization substance protein B